MLPLNQPIHQHLQVGPLTLLHFILKVAFLPNLLVNYTVGHNSGVSFGSVRSSRNHNVRPCVHPTSPNLSRAVSIIIFLSQASAFSYHSLTSLSTISLSSLMRRSLKHFVLLLSLPSPSLYDCLIFWVTANRYYPVPAVILEI